jgi:hypothetical protein
MIPAGNDQGVPCHCPAPPWGCLFLPRVGGDSRSEDDEEGLNCSHGGRSANGREELSPQLNGEVHGFGVCDLKLVELCKLLCITSPQTWK